MFWTVSRKVGPIRIGVVGRFRSPRRGGGRSRPTQAELQKQKRAEFLDSTQAQFQDLINQYVLSRGYLEPTSDDPVFEPIARMLEDFSRVQRLLRDGGALTANRRESLLNAIYFMEEQVNGIINPSPLFALSLAVNRYKTAGSALLRISVLILIAGVFFIPIPLVVVAIAVASASIYCFRHAGRVGSEMRRIAEAAGIERSADAVVHDQRSLELPAPEPDAAGGLSRLLPSGGDPETRGALANAPVVVPPFVDRRRADETKEDYASAAGASMPDDDSPALHDRPRWTNRLVQIVLLLTVFAIIVGGLLNSDATNMRPVWAGFGWALMTVAYVTFVCQLFGLRPVVRRVHAAILVPLFVFALVAYELSVCNL